jgi:hypothetical protein
MAFVSCRYKDNDKFVIATVKQRLEKTWYLKEYTLNDVSTYFYEETLTLSEYKNNKIHIEINNRGFSRLYFLKNKNTITQPDDNTGRNLKITKLTKNELWIEGDRIISTPGFYSNDKIKAKYSSKK